MAVARQRLSDEYGLKDNPDVLFGFADTLYAQYRWADCFAVTTRSVLSRNQPPHIEFLAPRRILELVDIHNPTMPLHVACMYHLQHLHSRLFMLAHQLVEKEPESAICWYAVGVWYFAAERWTDARNYLRFVPTCSGIIALPIHYRSLHQ